jgi:hypothetical protein
MVFKRSLTFSLPWLTTPCGVSGYAVEAIQVGGVKGSHSLKAKAPGGGGTYFERSWQLIIQSWHLRDRHLDQQKPNTERSVGGKPRVPEKDERTAGLPDDR